MTHATRLMWSAGIACGAVALTTNPIFAQDAVWDGEAGDSLWFSDDNWDPDGVPAEGADVLANAKMPIIVEGPNNHLIAGQLISQGAGLHVLNAFIRVDGTSEILNFLLNGCCVSDVITNGELTIGGQSEFIQRPAFFGPERVRIEGTTIFNQGLIADGLVTIDGDATFLPGPAYWARTSQIQVPGTITMIGSAALTSSAGVGWTVLGTVQSEQPGPNPASISADLQVVNGGTIRAREGRLLLSGPFRFDDGVIDVRDGGTVEINPLQGAGSFDFASFTGEGTIDFRSGDIRSQVNSSVRAVDGLGLRLRTVARFQSGGALNSTGDLLLGGRTEGEGVINIAGGTTQTFTSFNNVIPMNIIGGTFDLRHTITTAAPLTIAGGEFNLRQGGTLQNNGAENGKLVLTSGTLKTSPSLSNSVLIAMNIPAEADGGFMLIEGGRVEFRRRFAWSGGELNFGTGGDAVFGFVGGSADPVTISGDVLASGRGTLFLGGVSSGFKPDINIIGTLTTNIGAIDDRVARTELRTRVLGEGSLINTGYLEIESGARIEGNYVNTGVTRAVAFGTTVTGQVSNLGLWEHDRTMNVVGGTIVNTGLWRVRSSGSDLTNISGTFVNTTTYEVDGGASPSRINHFIGTQFSNTGVLTATNAVVTVTLSEQVTPEGAITGGSWVAGPNGVIRFPGTIRTLTGPTTAIRGGGDGLPELRDLMTLDSCAELATSDGFDFDENLTIQNNAELFVESGTSIVPLLKTKSGGSVRVGSDARLESPAPVQVGEPPADGIPSVTDELEFVLPLSRGTATPGVVNAPTVEIHGVIMAGEDAIATGRIEGDLTMFGTATLKTDLAVGESDLIEVTGDAQLAGVVRIRVPEGFEPSDTDEWTILTSGGVVSGAFDAVLTSPPGGPAFSAQIRGGDVVLTPRCPADVTGDGSADFFDVQVFLDAFSNAEPLADYSADGTFDFFDVQLFLDAFSDGC